MAETIRKYGVYAPSGRFDNEPLSARNWAYFLTSDEMESAVARSRDEGTVIRPAGRLSVDDMLVAARSCRDPFSRPPVEQLREPAPKSRSRLLVCIARIRRSLES